MVGRKVRLSLGKLALNLYQPYQAYTDANASQQRCTPSLRHPGAPSAATQYDPRASDWYKRVAKVKSAWSSIFYAEASDSLAITAAQQIVSSSGTLLGVASVQLYITERCHHRRCYHCPHRRRSANLTT